MNKDVIINRINALKEWKFKAQDLVKYNDYIKGFDEAVTMEIEFLLNLLSEKSS